MYNLPQYANYTLFLAQGLWFTLAVTALALLLATVFGLLWALFRTSEIGFLSNPTRVFIEVIRGIPLLVILLYIYFVAPEVGIDLTAFQAGVVGLAIAHSCYLGETFRAGIEAIDKGQIEAALSIGMRKPLMTRRVIIPQSLTHKGWQHFTLSPAFL
ncbi:polar amino acid transport system permease protein [Rhizobiales bacterium GAS188]|nr:polar amino acid transport system permease protein [Rhizobiales bacterium GAS188]